MPRSRAMRSTSSARSPGRVIESFFEATRGSYHDPTGNLAHLRGYEPTPLHPSPAAGWAKPPLSRRLAGESLGVAAYEVDEAGGLHAEEPVGLQTDVGLRPAASFGEQLGSHLYGRLRQACFP